MSDENKPVLVSDQTRSGGGNALTPQEKLVGKTLKKTIQLTPEERSLLLRYGYPFERIEHALKACEGSHDIEIVSMDCFELGRLIGDMCRSINHMNRGALQNQLLDLCDRLEAAEQFGDGMLDVL